MATKVRQTFMHIQKRFSSCLNTLKYKKATKSNIKAETEVSNIHLTPEISLHLITPNTPTWYSDGKESKLTEPFYAFYWPGGQGLSRFILDNSDLVKNKRILDFGSGCGASSIASIMSEASNVTANDTNQEAMIILEMNCQLNFIAENQINKITKNLISSNIESFPYDVVLIGDMFYDEIMARELIEWINKITRKGKDIYLGDPQRNTVIDSISNRLKLMASYNLPENVRIENNGISTTKVWKFE